MLKRVSVSQVAVFDASTGGCPRRWWFQKVGGREEPSSPVPILLRRAKRLVGKNFEELLADLAPGGMEELRHFAGNTDTSE